MQYNILFMQYTGSFLTSHKLVYRRQSHVIIIIIIKSERHDDDFKVVNVVFSHVFVFFPAVTMMFVCLRYDKLHIQRIYNDDDGDMCGCGYSNIMTVQLTCCRTGNSVVVSTFS